MHKHTKLFCALASLAFACAHTPAQTTAFGGKDNLQSALDAAAQSPEKTLILKGNFQIDKPLVLSNKHDGLKIIGDGNPIVSGGKKVESWRKNGEILEAKFDADNVEVVFVNGVRAQCAQTNEFLYMHSAYEGKTNPDGTPRKTPERNVFIARNVDLSALEGLSKEELAEVEIDIFRNWYNFKAKIEAIVKNPDGETSTVFLYEKMGRPFIRKGVKTPPRFKLCNIKKCLDTAGEFFFDKKSKTLFYIPREGETPTNISAFVPQISNALSVRGESPRNPVKNITISGVTFECGALLPDENWSPAVQAASSTDGFVNAINARSFTMQNCVIRNVNTYGICLKASVKNSAVKDCILRDCGSGGISITSCQKLSHVPGLRPGKDNPKECLTEFINIENNIICGYGRWNRGGIGIAVFDCGNIVLNHNTIFDGYYSGISSGWTWGYGKTHVQNNRYTNNKIFNIGYNALCDMGGIYTLGRSEGTVISGNDISNIQRHQYGGWGIYNDEGSSGFTIENNYVHDTQEDSYFLHYGKHIKVRNNIFTNAEISQLGISGGCLTVDPAEVDNAPKGKKPARLGDLKFERNIVVLPPDTKMFRGNMSPKKKNVKSKVFENNIYWQSGKELKFGKYTFAQWQNDLGQDTRSFAVNPQWNAKTLSFENDAYKKIGFVPFDISKAGVRGEMKKKFDSMMKNYKFPPSSKIPAIPPWRTDKSKDALIMQ